MLIKACLRFILILTLIIGSAGCNLLSVTSAKEKIPEVAILAPPSLPNWIEQISPLGDAKTLSQIRVRFKEALIPVEQLESPHQESLLAKFALWPPLPGQFRFLTPRMVGFQADKALPNGTRFKVTLKAGLADLKKHRLDKDLDWTFNTDRINLTNLPGVNPIEKGDIEPVNLQPKLQFTSNMELDLVSVEQHSHLIPEGKNQGVSFRVELAKDDQSENLDSQENTQEKFDPSSRDWVYNLIPQQGLTPATNYRLIFSPGIFPAYGNLQSDKEFVSKIVTYSPLAFQAIAPYGQPDSQGTNGRFVKGSPQLQFNNILEPSSVKENIKINPSPRAISEVLQFAEGDRIVGINPYALQPTTTYTITIGENLKDKFGQTLGKPVTIKYDTGDLAGDIWAPANLNIFPLSKDLQLNINTLNLPESKYQANYRLVQPIDLVYADNSSDLLPKPETWQNFNISVKKNQSVDINVPLREKISSSTGMLAYGIKAHTNKYEENGKELWQEPTIYGMVQLTNLGVFSQWFPELGLIRVHHLDDGVPVKAAKIEIYQSRLSAKSHPQPSPCASGQTDENGSFQVQGADLQRCYASKQADTTSPQLLVIARENQDWAFARTEEYSGVFGYGIEAGWRDNKPESRGIIFSDRQLYQPGEKAWLTGFADFLSKGEIRQDKNSRYQVTLFSPDGKKTDLGKKTTNEFGTFALEVPIPKNIGLGYYNVKAKGKDGQEISGDFRVAEFKPPNFKVELKLNQQFAFIDDKIQAQVASKYLFGSPVEGGEAKYFVTRQQINFVPQGREDFSFGRQWFWPEESPVVSQDVLQTKTQLDANGKSNQVLTVAQDLPYPMTYQVDVQVADVSNLSVADSKTFTALPSHRLIGLKGNFVAEAGKSFPIEFIVTDPNGKLLENQRVHIELQQIKYSTVTQLIEGGRTPKNQIEYHPVDQKDLISSNIPQSINFQPPESGSYRIRANFSDTKDELSATDLQIWVTGQNPVFWGNQDKELLEVKLNQKAFKVGETATALIQSPYPEGELYFAVIKDKPLYQQTIKVKGSAPQIQFQVTPEMLPNAAVEAVLVRQGKPLHELGVGTLENLVRVGFAPFKVDLTDKYLKVDVTPSNNSLEPGAQQSLSLELKDIQGKPTRGQLTVMVVNEAVLQLSGYRPPDLIDTVYAEQSISTRFKDNRPDVVIEQQAIAKPKGWGFGGGLSSALANTRVRKDFQALAYYNAAILTDENGRATVNFKLPDDLTTWRVMVVATDGNLRFGNGNATFTTTKPLITNAILPQFARIGDRLLGGLSVTNTTNQGGTLSIKGELSGALKFVDGNSTVTTLQTKAESTTKAYRFPMVVDSEEQSKVQFTSQLNNSLNNSFTDAFSVPLEIKPLEISEQVVETGEVQGNNWIWGNQAKIPLNIAKNSVVDSAGGLDIQLASTLIPQIQAPAEETFNDTDLPFAEPAASQLLVAANLQKLAEKHYLFNARINAQKQANQAFEELQTLQLADGGFAAFPKQAKSDPWISTYVTESLVRAKKSFPNLVNSRMLSQLKTYLQKVLANPGQYDFCQAKLCKSQLQLNSLIALAQLGDKRNSFLADIYQQRDNFDLVTQIKLGRYLSEFPEWEKESQLIKSKLQKSIYETGRAAVVNLPVSWGWMNSLTTTQAEALRLFIQQKSPQEFIDKLVQSLLNLRRNGTWLTSYNNAQALTALVEYSQLQPTPPDFTVTTKLAGTKLSEDRFKGYEKSSSQLHIPMDKLPQGHNDLILQKNGGGTLHYLVTYNYRLRGNQPGRFNGLRVTREISNVNNSPENQLIRKIGLYSGDKPLTLATGQVFDIGLEIICDRPIDHLVIQDPLPAGLEAIDESFQTATQALKAKSDSWELGFKTIKSDRILAYADHLEAGVYKLHYLVRSVTPGTFFWSGSQVHLEYTPEEFGRSADTTLILQEPGAKS